MCIFIYRYVFFSLLYNIDVIVIIVINLRVDIYALLMRSVRWRLLLLLLMLFLMFLSHWQSNFLTFYYLIILLITFPQNKMILDLNGYPFIICYKFVMFILFLWCIIYLWTRHKIFLVICTFKSKNSQYFHSYEVFQILKLHSSSQIWNSIWRSIYTLYINSYIFLQKEFTCSLQKYHSHLTYFNCSRLI